MYKFIGYSEGKGTFKGSDGQEIAYSNRMLKFITDNTAEGVIGWDFYEHKVKAKDLASWFGCTTADDTEVNMHLDSILGEHCELSFVPRNGKLELNKINIVGDYNPIDKHSQKITSDNAKK